jgi:hypothetical protein
VPGRKSSAFGRRLTRWVAVSAVLAAAAVTALIARLSGGRAETGVASHAGPAAGGARHRGHRTAQSLPRAASLLLQRNRLLRSRLADSVLGRQLRPPPAGEGTLRSRWPVLRPPRRWYRPLKRRRLHRLVSSPRPMARSAWLAISRWPAAFGWSGSSSQWASWSTSTASLSAAISRTAWQ